MTPLVLFDLDGTLVDTPTAIVDNFTATLASLGFPAAEAPAIRATIGRPLGEAFGELMGTRPESDAVAAAMVRYQEFYRERIVPRARELLYPGVAEGLAALHADDHLLAIATSKFTASAEILLTAAGLREYFALVVGADGVSRPKPDPEVGLLICEKLGFQPSQAIMVGDTTHDLHMARNAGLRSIAVTYGIHSTAELRTADPTWIVDTFDAVTDRIGRAG